MKIPQDFYLWDISEIFYPGHPGLGLGPGSRFLGGMGY